MGPHFDRDPRLSDWYSFEDTDVRARRKHSRKLEAGFGQQGTIFHLSSLPPTWNDQHVQVQELGKGRFIPRRDDAFDDEKLGRWFHGLAAITQNGLRL